MDGFRGLGMAAVVALLWVPAGRGGPPAELAGPLAAAAARAGGLYRAFHREPEASGMERASAALVAAELSAAGFAVTTGIGGHGVVGRLDSGSGPVVALRAELDALPVSEATGWDFASTRTGRDREGQVVPLAHACGHDLHLAALLGAARVLAACKDRWRGTLLALAQPAEETGDGARAMVADGLWKRFPAPAAVLAQHVALPLAGVLGYGPDRPQADRTRLEVEFRGRGGHGAGGAGAVDPIPMAAAFAVEVGRWAAREAGAGISLRVGRIRAGLADNVVPETARVEVDLRSPDPADAARVGAALAARADEIARRAGAPAAPRIEAVLKVPGPRPDPGLMAGIRAAQGAWVGGGAPGRPPGHPRHRRRRAPGPPGREARLLVPGGLRPGPAGGTTPRARLRPGPRGRPAGRDRGAGVRRPRGPGRALRGDLRPGPRTTRS